jgi:cytochrome c biogenesis protein CcmG/thiol:disulfide interchange protein DsbE
MRRRLAAAAAVLLAASVAGCSTPEKKPETRLPAATLAPLRTSDAKASLRDLTGPMVVNLWANWCKPCRKEMPILQRFHLRHPGVKVLGVDWQDPNREKALAFAAEAKVTYPLVVDDRPVLRAQGLPKLILLDENGRIAFQEYVAITSLAQLETLVRKHLGVTL